MKRLRLWVFITIHSVMAIGSSAEVRLPHVFGDNMVLQRGQPVPIWGHAAPGEQVTVRFANQVRQTTANDDGTWRTQLAALTASAVPGTMQIRGANVITFKNVLVGEVWLCSGQSNMEYPASLPHWDKANDLPLAPGEAPASKQPSPAALRELALVDLPHVRLFKVEKKLQPGDVRTRGWTECRGEALTLFSSLGYHFGRELQHALDVPVGVIAVAWGGSRIEPWTPAAGYASTPAFSREVAHAPLTIDGVQPGKYFDALVAPLAPFALRGVLWYQGESNIISGNDGLRYADKLLALIRGWRQVWGQGEMPFYSVQLAPFTYTTRQHDPVSHTIESLPELWEAQFLAQRIPQTGLVPTTDLVEDVTNIHPRDKSEVARRLCNLAMAKTYGRRDVVWRGPTCARVEFAGHAAIVHFSGVESGLRTRDGQSPTDFEIAGADNVFAPAQAQIKGSEVIVWREGVEPTAVRFAWRETAQPNLVNGAGWPAYPFRSNTPRWAPH